MTEAAIIAGLWLVITVLILLGIGALLWTCTDGYAERVCQRRAMNSLDLERARRQMNLDLKLKEWQDTCSLEELTRHRQRLAGELDKLYDDDGLDR